MESGVAKKPIENWGKYQEELEQRLGLDNKIVTSLVDRARKDPQKVVFAEADNYKILKAAQIVKDEGIAIPILLGKVDRIKEMIETYELDLGDVPILDPRSRKQEELRDKFAQNFYELRQRKGYTLFEAKQIMRERNYFGTALVKWGEADAFISGITRNYPDTLRPALQIIGANSKQKNIAGMYILNTKKGPLFLADTTINFNPTAQELVDITVLTAEAIRGYKLKPRIAMLGYGNFGSSVGEDSKKVQEAVRILHKNHPDIIVDGEIQANFALNQELTGEFFPFSLLAKHRVNTLIFPNLASGNIAYKLMQQISDIETMGPILLGMKKPVHILQLGCTVREIINMVKRMGMVIRLKADKIQEYKKTKRTVL